MDEQYKHAVREVLEKRGRAVCFENDGELDYWGEKTVSTYGWEDYDTTAHIYTDKCAWVIEPGAKVKEVSYSQFVDTFTSNRIEVGLNVDGAKCRCGKYTDVTLRYVGTLGEILHEILKVPKSNQYFTI